MSAEATAWATKQVAGGPVDKLVLIYLSDWTDMAGRWVIKLHNLAPYVEMTEDDLMDSILRLEDRGLILVDGDVLYLSFLHGWMTDKWINTPTVKIPKSVRNEVYSRDGHACIYCGSSEKLSLDHLLPKSRGGGDGIENLGTACRSCNSRKATRTEQEYRTILEAGS